MSALSDCISCLWQPWNPTIVWMKIILQKILQSQQFFNLPLKMLSYRRVLHLYYHCRSFKHKRLKLGHTENIYYYFSASSEIWWRIWLYWQFLIRFIDYYYSVGGLLFLFGQRVCALRGGNRRLRIRAITVATSHAYRPRLDLGVAESVRSRAVWQLQPKVAQTMQQHFTCEILWIRRTCDYI